MKLTATALLASIVILPCLAITVPPVNKNKTYGDARAPIMIEVFHDFTCGHCKILHETMLPQLLKEYVYTNKVYVVDRSFPLQGHMFTRDAATYAVAASRIGKYMAVTDALFAKQAIWAVNGEVWKVVSSVLTPTEQKKVQELFKDPGVAAEIDADYQEGIASGVNSTPTMVLTVKGQRKVLPTAPDYRLLKAMIDAYVK